MKRFCRILSAREQAPTFLAQVQKAFPQSETQSQTDPKQQWAKCDLLIIEGDLILNSEQLIPLLSRSVVTLFLPLPEQLPWVSQIHDPTLLVGQEPGNYGNLLFVHLNQARHLIDLHYTLEHRTLELNGMRHRMELLVEAARDVGNYDNLNTLAPRLMEKFVKSMAAEGGSLFLRIPQGLRRVYSLDPGHAPDIIPFPVKPGSPLALLVDEKKALLIEDFQQLSLLSSGWRGYTGTSGLILPLLDKKGQLTGVITLHNKKGDPFTEQDKGLGLILAAFCAEVIQSHRAMERLADSEDRYKELFLEDMTANFLADPSGRILLSNPAFQELFETSTKGGSCYLHHFFPDPTQWDSLMEDLDKHGILHFEDQELRTLGGKSVWITGKMLVHDKAATTPSPIQGYFMDITKRKRLEGLMAHSEKMEALGRLAGGVAHDYNNLMTAILGYAELLYDEVQSPQGKIDLEEITKAAERAGHLTRQLLTLGRRDYMVEKVKFAPDAIVANLHGLLKQLINQGHKLILDLDAPATTIHFNPAQLEQIVMNLVVNARDSMPNGGVIHLRSAQLAAFSPTVLLRPELEPRPHWILKVSDTGSGIERSVLPHIFEPFFSTKDQGKGTGLGLATVYNGVQSGGGTIEVESTLGIGTDFILYFPVEDSHGHEPGSLGA